MRPKKDSQEALRARNAIREAEAARRRAKLAEEEKKEAGFRAALLATSPRARSLVDRFVEYKEAQLLNKWPLPAYSGIHFLIGVPDELQTEAFIQIARVIERKAPKLLDAATMKAAAWIATLPFVRPVEDWTPRGKGRDTVFRSLADHLLAKYPVPAILWNAFSDDNAKEFVPLVGHVAAGGSLIDYAKRNFPIPLTRAMCHAFLTTSADYRFLDAIRLVQAKTAGADRRFFNAWRTTRYATMIGTREEEAFWYTVVEWFGKLAMLNPAEVGPLCDYIAMRRRADPTFSMKGRGGVATIRAMHEWHGNLTKEKGIKASTIYRTSGFKPLVFDDYKRKEPNGDVVHETWRIEEILTAKRLYDEGRRMGHCVYSYGWRIEKGDTSIWSVIMQDGKGETGAWIMVTVEVRNDLRRIVQARGRFNRRMESREQDVLNRWANLNNLEVSLGLW